MKDSPHASCARNWSLEKAVLEREAAGQDTGLTAAELGPIDRKSKDLGLWGLDASPESGAADTW